MEMELRMSNDLIHGILKKCLECPKIYAHFVPKLTDDQKLLRVQHCIERVKNSKRTKYYLKTIFTGDQMWSFR